MVSKKIGWLQERERLAKKFQILRRFVFDLPVVERHAMAMASKFLERASKKLEVSLFKHSYKYSTFFLLPSFTSSPKTNSQSSISNTTQRPLDQFRQIGKQIGQRGTHQQHNIWNKVWLRFMSSVSTFQEGVLFANFTIWQRQVKILLTDFRCVNCSLVINPFGNPAFVQCSCAYACK